MHPGTKSTEHRSSMKSASGGGYTSEEFESYADSRMDRTLRFVFSWYLFDAQNVSYLLYSDVHQNFKLWIFQFMLYTCSVIQFL